MAARHQLLGLQTYALCPAIQIGGRFPQGGRCAQFSRCQTFDTAYISTTMFLHFGSFFSFAIAYYGLGEDRPAWVVRLTPKVRRLVSKLYSQRLYYRLSGSTDSALRAWCATRFGASKSPGLIGAHIST